MIELFAPVARCIDRVVIRMALMRLEARAAGECLPAEALTPAAVADFFEVGARPPEEVEFRGRHGFFCDSPLPGVAPESRRIYGRFYRCGEDWRNRPTIIMLHGWNGENSDRLLFPLLARRFRRLGINLLSFVLPCHGKRRARSGPGCDFISPDVSVMLQSTRQALADAQALIGWLRRETSGPIGIWGISLGAWLAGLLACHDDRLSWAVLMSPIVRMDRAIQELDFCAPIRRSLAGRELPFQGLNLTDHRPRLDRQNLLLVAGSHDLFTPQSSVEELWEFWNYPPIERFDHGHLTILVSAKAMLRAIRFVRDRAEKARVC